MGLTFLLLLLLNACGALWTDDDELNLRDLDGDGVPYAEDCDDHDPGVGADRYLRDEDGDGYGDDDIGLGCDLPSGDTPWAEEGGDCDDDHRAVNPETRWYVDADGDGWLAAAAEAVVQCEDPDGGDARALPQHWLQANTTGSSEYDALGDGDCDDADPGLHPETQWTPDDDGDGHGDLAPSSEEIVTQCAAPQGFVRLDLADDCDDEDELINPETLWFRDADLDGYGVAEDSLQSCVPPEGYTARLDGDCDDSTEYFTRLCPFTQVSVGRGQACALRSDGSPFCWGDSFSGETSPPADAEYVEVRINQNYACGITAERTLECWGLPSIVDAAPTGDGIEVLGAGWAGACAIQDGELRCLFGPDDAGDDRTPAPEGSGFVDVGMNRWVGCALHETSQGNELQCWGHPDYSVQMMSAFRPSEPLVSLDVSDINPFACGIMESGSLYCGGIYAPSQLRSPPSGSDYVDVSVGFTHACALRETGEVRCWGQAVDEGAMVVPTEDGRPISFVSIDAAHDQVCGVDELGRLHCWGVGAAVPASGLEHLGLGPRHGCASFQGTLGCWGSHEPELALGDFTSVRVDEAACAFTAAGEMKCQGYLNRLVRLEGTAPVEDEMGRPITYQDVSTLYAYWSPGSDANGIIYDNKKGGCALTTDGELRCFGEDSLSDLPAGEGWSRFSFAWQYEELSDSEHSWWEPFQVLCAVHEAGDLECHGALTESAPTDADFIDVVVLSTAICALHEDGRVTCFNDDPSAPVIADAPTGDGFVKLERADETQEYAGGGYPDAYGTPTGVVSGACALHESGEGVCWGEFRGGEPPLPSGVALTDLDISVLNACGLDASGVVRCEGEEIDDLEPFTSQGRYLDIDAGSSTWCAVREDGHVICAGLHDTIAELVDIHALTAIAPGARHTCALVDGAVYCEGVGAVAEDEPSIYEAFTELASGDYHACALDPQGAVACWGDDLFGQASPPSTDGQVRLVAGGDSTCALDADGAVTCWGLVSWEQAGPFVDVAVGGEHACAVYEGGEVTCVGDDAYGQASPPEGASFQALALGDWHSCGLLQTGLATCWGLDADRQVRGVPNATFTALYAAGDQTCGLGLDGLPLCWGRAYQGVCEDPPLPTELGTCGG